MQQKMSKIWCATVFRLPWQKKSFSITTKASLKAFEDITEPSQLENITLIHISLLYTKKFYHMACSARKKISGTINHGQT